VDGSFHPAHGTDSSNAVLPQLSALSGVENLLLGSQGWWFKDQSALANGLENWDGSWNVAPSDGGGSMNYDSTIPATTSSSTGNYSSQMITDNSQYPGGMAMNMGTQQAFVGGNYIIPNSGPSPTTNSLQDKSQGQTQRKGYGQNGDNFYY
jgi:hypothetical protein